MRLIKEDKHLQKSLSLIKCECGEYILLVPDLRAMNNAIESHLLVHRKEESDPSKTEATVKRIRYLLFGQVFDKIDQSR